MTVAIVTGGFLTVCLVFERFTIGRLRVEHTMQIFYLQSHLDLSGKNGCNDWHQIDKSVKHQIDKSVKYEIDKSVKQEIDKSVKHQIDKNRLFFHL